jgi:hypothetical protein
MGAFQAVASGLGEAGEQLGQGANAALNDALKVRSQMMEEQYRSGELDLRRQQLQQQGQIANQQQDLMRNYYIQQGWRDMGVSMDPGTGNYSRSFYNETTKESTTVPVSGVPPDSPQGLMAYYKNIRGMQDDKGNPLFSDLQAKQIAFKMPQLYREGPVGMMQGFRDYAAELADQGMTNIKSSTGKQLDISTPEGQQAFAQDQIDLVYGRTGFFHYGMGGVAGGRPVDMTGFTAGEKREADATLAPLKQQEHAITGLMNAAMANTYTPDQRAAVQAQFMPALMEIYNKEQEVLNSIKARRGPAVSPEQSTAIKNLMGATGMQPPAGAPQATPPAGGAGGQGAGGGWAPPPGSPSPVGLKDGALLRDKVTGKVIAKIKNNTWVKYSE